MIYFVPWLFITVHCSGPLFIVPRTTASVFTNFGKILPTKVKSRYQSHSYIASHICHHLHSKKSDHRRYRNPATSKNELSVKAVNDYQ